MNHLPTPSIENDITKSSYEEQINEHSAKNCMKKIHVFYIIIRHVRQLIKITILCYFLDFIMLVVCLLHK